MTRKAPARIRIDTGKIFARHPFAGEILQKLTDAGHEAVLIGGTVRDAVRARLEDHPDFEPEEIDIATSAVPREIKRILTGYRILEVGAVFGVLTVMSPMGEAYEIATFRTEGEYDGRWPRQIQLIRDLQHDVQRRDFTINGLAARADGEVIDLVGGVRDLQRKIIQTIGDPQERFREDYLRLLRAIRFACSLDAQLAPATSTAIRAHREGLLLISAERIRDELWALLGTRRSAHGIQLLDDHGLLELILPEVAACKDVPQPEEYHPEGDVYTHTLLALRVADRFIRDARVKFALLLHDIGKRQALEENRGENAAGHDAIGAQMAHEIGRRLRLSNEDRSLIEYLVREHQRIGHFPEMGRGKQVKFIRQGEDPTQEIENFPARYPYFAKLLQLMIADCQASAMKSNGWFPVIQITEELRVHLQELERLTRARSLINGHDLLNMGVPKGPQIGQLLDELHEQVFAGEIRSRDEALAEAQRLITARNLRRR
jgi:tRNA nucleotidyltransferase/poly(A) polymerase